VNRLTTEPSLTPLNRKYLGSKRQLRAWIADRIVEAAGVPESFLDGFCGTGAVGLELLERGAGRVTAVDALVSNRVILAGACAAPVDPAGRARLAGLLDRLNGLAPRDGYITDSYAGAYFTADNCRRMDAVREEIERLRADGQVEAAVHDWVLGCFLLAADRVANTLGQYDAFLKHIDSASTVAGRHVRDGRVTDPFVLRPLAPVYRGGALEVIAADLLAGPELPAHDVAYLDPPYNGRQYCDNYHVLENLARWSRPVLHGRTRKFDRTGLRSPFSTRRGAAGAFARVLGRIRARHLFVSYSSEGILDRGAIAGMLEGWGAVTVHEESYPVFGNGAGVSRRRQVTELLFHAARRG
jgi:adenine-specific DNA-methyltransferase